MKTPRMAARVSRATADVHAPPTALWKKEPTAGWFSTMYDGKLRGQRRRPHDPDAQVGDRRLAEGLDRVGALAGLVVLDRALERRDAIGDLSHRADQVDRLLVAEPDRDVEAACKVSAIVRATTHR